LVLLLLDIFIRLDTANWRQWRLRH